MKKEEKPIIGISLSAYKNTIIMQVRIKNKYILREITVDESEKVVTFFKKLFDKYKKKEKKTIEFEL